MKNAVLTFAAWMARLLPLPVKRALYRFKPLAGAIRGTLNRAAPQGQAQVSVAAGELAGARLYLDLHSEKDYWLGTYEPELQQAVLELIRPGMVVYDVGANIGYVSLLLARRVGSGGSVFAFEALPANLERLRANLALNEFAGIVSVVPCAVIDAPRPIQFLVGPSGGMGKAQGSAGRQEFGYAQSIQVEGISLDHFVYSAGNPPPQAVKMDIEGGEVLALPGMRRLLLEQRPLILLELHGPQAGQVVWATLKGAHYRICRMQSGYPAVASLDELDWKAYWVGMPGTPQDR
ncbi:MAG: FkbM family methyltransferase [Chloroflexota bacterium]